MLGASSDIDLGINLAQWNMNLSGDMSLSEHPDAPPIGISVIGALHDPEITYNTKTLEGFIGQKIAASLLQNMVEGNGGIGDLFGGIPGAQGEVEPSTEPTTEGDAVPAANEDDVITSPLDDFITPPSELPAEPEPEQQAPAEEERPETVEELGAKLLERLFQKPPPPKN